MRRRRELRALVACRQMLGLAGRPRMWEVGTVVRRGVNEKLREKCEAGRGEKREVLLRRVEHFTHGVLVGTREYGSRWFDGNRDYVKGRSQSTRKTGAWPIGKGRDWGGLSSFRAV